MTEVGDENGRTEQLRAAFQQQDASGRAEQAARERAQKRRAHTVAAVGAAVIGVIVLVYRLTRGERVGAWTALIAAGLCLATLGGFLARRDRPRLSFTATVAGLLLTSTSDMVGGVP